MNESREEVGCLCSRAGTKEAKAGVAREEAREGRQGVGENRGQAAARDEAAAVVSYNAVTTPEMAQRAAEGLARGLSVKRAMEEAPCEVQFGNR